jgi:polyisoprenoid-binding protein YceI
MSFRIHAFVLVLAMAAFAYQAAPAELLSGTLELDPSKTLIEFRLPAALHTTHGIFKLEHGTIRGDLGTSEASGSIVVDARSGDSGLGLRDRRMKSSVLEVQKYPEIIFTPRYVVGQLAKDGQFQAKLKGVMTIHGAGHQIALEVQGRLTGDDLVATTHFSVPYVEWGMEDPSLIFTVQKQVDIDIATEGHIVWTGNPLRSSHK